VTEPFQYPLLEDLPKNKELPFISYNDLILYMEKAIEAKGEDYVYPNLDSGCVYVAQGAPSCAVGFILDFAGIVDSTVWKANPDVYPTWNSAGISALIEVVDGENVDCPAQALLATDIQGSAFLQTLQILQDVKYPWKQAFDAAKACAEDHDKFERLAAEGPRPEDYPDLEAFFA